MTTEDIATWGIGYVVSVGFFAIMMLFLAIYLWLRGRQ